MKGIHASVFAETDTVTWCREWGLGGGHGGVYNSLLANSG